MTHEEKLAIEARTLLAVERNRETAIQKLCIYHSASQEDATMIVSATYYSNRSLNRKAAFMKLIGGIVGVVVFTVVLLFVRMFLQYIVAGMIASAAVAVWGLASTLAAKGYEID